ncbi:MAG: HAMP domain-containing protein [Betaproteobacteria bacterium]|nr:HAMP domain-containing protein [Betaproteobacteria bacterium]
MKNRARVIGLATGLFFVLALFVVGTWLETKIFDGLTHILQNQTFLSVILFFSIVNLNAVLAFVLIFLSFRNAVKLVVERQRAVFGSSLRTRLVTLFLFFSLVPTLILLYISTKFVNVRFENWMPPSIAETAAQSFKSENVYRDKMIELLNHQVRSLDTPSNFDFVVPVERTARDKSQIKQEHVALKSQIHARLDAESGGLSATAVALRLSPDRHVFAARQGDYFVGHVSPPSFQAQWALLNQELAEAHPGVELVRLSYYILLGALTVLLIFSALWLGVTIARELTGPLQTLAHATNSVAQGNYDVNIDDVVSDDELGQLARSFRSMVGDLRDAQGRARASAAELEFKAAQLSEKTDYYASVLKEIQAAVFSMDNELKLESCNPAAERLFSFRAADTQGLTLAEVLPSDFYLRWLKPLLMPLLERGERRVEGEYSGRLGLADFQLVVAAIALTKPNGERAILVIAEDVTHIARAQRSAAWREVARKVAHEIKNPLTPIKLGAQRLERRLLGRMEGQDRDVLKESLGVIVQSSDTIKRLVDEFVSVARMPGARMQQANILDTLRFAAAAFSENPEQVSIAIEYWDREQGSYQTLIPGRLIESFLVKFDPEQIGRALINLLSNAISASAAVADAREVVIRAGSAALESGTLEISVLDWGSGVPESVRDRIFEPYFSTKRTGTGLGLVIVQQIVHEHGGQLRVAPNQPRGSVFTMSLST